MRIESIGHVESPFPVKFGVPRQPGLVPGLVSWLVLDSRTAPSGGAFVASAPEGEDIPFSGDGGLAWVVWQFSENAGRASSPTIRPPRLGGNVRVGVFASRSSFRPNGLAVSAVRVAGADAAGRIALVGADMVDGTPVYGLRPYDRARDSFPGAAAGWTGGTAWPRLSRVVYGPGLEERVPLELRCGVREMLLLDPRPAYTRGSQEGRVFWVPVGHVVVSFKVDGATVLVVDVTELDEASYGRLRKTGEFRA